jgi:hypothetical protein
MGTVTNSRIQNNGNSDQHADKSGCWSLLLLFWIRLLVTVHINLDQAVDYCSHYFGSGCWLLFPLFFISMLITVPIISNQQPDPK